MSVCWGKKEERDEMREMGEVREGKWEASCGAAQRGSVRSEGGNGGL